jgi:glutamate-1-semialdehyde 2,1-aminomutase
LLAVLTYDAFVAMTDLPTRYTDGDPRYNPAHDLPWSVTQLGARAEYRFARPAPRTGSESHAAGDDDLDAYLHVFLVNRGVLLTPFHNMALTCPATTADDVDLHLEVFAEAVATLVG